MRRSHALPFYQELVGRHERVFGTEPVGHDPQAVKGCLVQVGALEAAD